MFEIEFSHTTARELEKIAKIDRKLYTRLVAAIEVLKTFPYAGKSLKGRLAGSYSLRVGSYRVIYTIQKNRLIIYIIDVGQRKEIYRVH